jgi:nanoRNase/pAp phosphatase (c-di-AMP/oligoRNAs hydrolase)
VDVRQLAQKSGGGGHTLAAGVNLEGPREKAMGAILAEIRQQLQTE